MKLIKFTAPNDSPVLINPEHVVRVHLSASGAGAVINLSDGGLQTVQESVVTVFEMLIGKEK
jgi:hypothetical protein